MIHKHASKGLTTKTHRKGYIAPRCPRTGILLMPNVSRRRVVEYTRHSEQHIDSKCYEVADE